MQKKPLDIISTPRKSISVNPSISLNAHAPKWKEESNEHNENARYEINSDVQHSITFILTSNLSLDNEQ